MHILVIQYGHGMFNAKYNITEVKDLIHSKLHLSAQSKNKGIIADADDLASYPYVVKIPNDDKYLIKQHKLRHYKHI